MSHNVFGCLVSSLSTQGLNNDTPCLFENSLIKLGSITPDLAPTTLVMVLPTSSQNPTHAQFHLPGPVLLKMGRRGEGGA